MKSQTIQVHIFFAKINLFCDIFALAFLEGKPIDNHYGSHAQ
jgi:hypothetical protein